MPSRKLNIGAHLSTKDGLVATIALGRQIGGRTIQIFSRNPRGGAQRKIGAEEIAAVQAKRRTAGLKTLIVHLPYTVNLASPRPEVYRFARRVLREDLRWSRQLGADLVVVHPGCHLGVGAPKGVRRSAATLRYVLKTHGDDSPRLLLETMSGQGTELGSEPWQLRGMLEQCDWHPALGLCLDSCHLFAAGHELRTPAGVEQLLSGLDDAVGLERLGCLHLNDSREPLGSHRDRHACIGEGQLGKAGVVSLLRQPRLAELPICLETPVDDPLDYRKQIRTVKRMLRR